jgi:hypothetical protein
MLLKTLLLVYNGKSSISITKKAGVIMGFIIFLLVIGALFVFILIVGAGLSLFSAIFGYDDYPYERDLARMDYEDEILDRLDDIQNRLDSRDF